jgi:tetratricopeptide (TPR) repeat protein
VSLEGDRLDRLARQALEAGEAEAAARNAYQAVRTDEGNGRYLNTLGIALAELGELADAEAILRGALEREPANPDAHFNLGKVLRKRGKVAEALEAFENLRRGHPRFPGTVEAICALHRAAGRPARAYEVVRDALGPATDDPVLTPLLALCVAEREGPHAAIGLLERLPHDDPRWLDARHLLGTLLLGLGRWREGWLAYAARKNLRGVRPGIPAAFPARLDGKHVRVHCEQGLGDALFFLRFVPTLRARGAAVSVVAPRALLPLLQRLAWDRPPQEQRTPGAAEGPCDYEVWAGDLPLRLDCEATPPPLRVAVDAAGIELWRSRLAASGPPPYVGVTWRGGASGTRELGVERALLMKDIAPAALGSALAGARGTLVSLQRLPRTGEREALSAAASAPVLDLSAVNADLAGMAALLSVLDDYVGVSNTNMHLRAAVGRMARVLVPYPPEWRWTFAESESPWFPGFATYRESAPGDWSAALGRLRADLAAG